MKKVKRIHRPEVPSNVLRNDFNNDSIETQRAKVKALEGEIQAIRDKIAKLDKKMSDRANKHSQEER